MYLRRLPPYGWIGLLGMLLAELFLILGVPLVRMYMTPVEWTFYILFVDGSVRAVRGRSLITSHTASFLLMLPWSVLTWLVFEVYNLHLHNWNYLGLPAARSVRDLSYVWAFATIMPAVLETADLIKVLLGSRSIAPLRIGPTIIVASIVAGMVMLTAPAALPGNVAGYLFGSVWIGFILLLDPVNYLLGGRSIIGDLEVGRVGRLASLLLAGVVTGGLWEFWNYWASAKWHYTLPGVLGSHPHYFEMPWMGFIGFIPFALELFAFFNLLDAVLRRMLPMLRPRGGGGILDDR